MVPVLVRLMCDQLDKADCKYAFAFELPSCQSQVSIRCTGGSRDEAPVYGLFFEVKVVKPDLPACRVRYDHWLCNCHRHFEHRASRLAIHRPCRHHANMNPRFKFCCIDLDVELRHVLPKRQYLDGEAPWFIHEHEARGNLDPVGTALDFKSHVCKGNKNSVERCDLLN